VIRLGAVYLIAGATFGAFALLGLAERKFANALFHALLAASFLVGDRIGDTGNGVLVVALIGVAASGRMRRSGPAADPPAPRGIGLFAVALAIPVVALAGTLAFAKLPWLVDAKQVTLVALTLGVLVALAACYLWLRPRPVEPFDAGRRLMDDIGWAAVLPQMLASLGAVFAAAGVGQVVGGVFGAAIPAGLFAAVAVYAVGMAAFTVVMGNAFAAFPVMASAVAIPVLVGRYGAPPAPVAAIGMLAGFCGTLLTPMAANFNLVPAALLDLKDRYGVIRAQAPTAAALLVFNTLLLWAVLR